ncbi:hypothetical protein DM02DRAFT_662269 [Periconia macrospinosa]|uniref:Ankyrin n=1 Tax=Periconia macrospinosa TaxID=97972 RepID=A0A2V1D573_9PLEO|nr:hypothetical protein DM02DRAFT_662269 [Periconia macrospinosa]
MAEAAARHETPEWVIRKRKTLAPAIVFKWNDWNTFVICPFPTCQREYQLVWPFEVNSIVGELQLVFELDRDAGVWRMLWAQPGTPKECSKVCLRIEQLGSISKTLRLKKSSRDQRKGLFASPGEEHLLEQLNCLALYEEEYMLFISSCVTGDIVQAGLCLKNTNSANMFLHRKDYDGNTALALACMEGHYDMARLQA